MERCWRMRGLGKRRQHRKSLLFLKKKKQKEFIHLGWAKQMKVFCFFLFTKRRFLLDGAFR